MSEHYKEYDTVAFDTNVTIEFIYKRNPTRVEECHGYHEFNEDEETMRFVSKVTIDYGGENPIDITDRHTDEELKQLANSRFV